MDIRKLMIVGSAEWCSLPDLKIPAIRSRIDSGAKTSAIHAVNIREFYKRRQQWVRFEIHPLRIHTDIFIECEAPVYDYRMVKSSSGEAQPRYVIQTYIVMGGEKWAIQMTLANRRTMGFQMLLGREAMTNRILINPSEDFRLTRYTRKQIREFYNLENTPPRKKKLRNPETAEKAAGEKGVAKVSSNEKSNLPEGKKKKQAPKSKKTVTKQTPKPKKSSKSSLTGAKSVKAKKVSKVKKKVSAKKASNLKKKLKSKKGVRFEQLNLFEFN